MLSWGWSPIFRCEFRRYKKYGGVREQALAEFDKTEPGRVYQAHDSHQPPFLKSFWTLIVLRLRNQHEILRSAGPIKRPKLEFKFLKDPLVLFSMWTPCCSVIKVFLLKYSAIVLKFEVDGEQQQIFALLSTKTYRENTLANNPGIWQGQRHRSGNFPDVFPRVFSILKKQSSYLFSRVLLDTFHLVMFHALCACVSLFFRDPGSNINNRQRALCLAAVVFMMTCAISAVFYGATDLDVSSIYWRGRSRPWMSSWGCRTLKSGSDILGNVLIWHTHNKSGMFFGDFLPHF